MNRAHTYRMGSVWVASLTLCGFVVCVQRCVHYYTRITSVTCTIDARLSADVVKTIASQIASLDLHAHAVAIQNIHNTQSCVRTITAHYGVPRTVHFCVTAHDPYLRLNDMTLMVADGGLISTDHYRADVYADLFTMRIPSADMADGHVSGDCYQLIKAIVPEFFDRFNITWYAKHHLLLYDKKNPTTIILCDTQSVPPLSLLDLPEKIGPRKQKKRARKTKYNIIDCRFTDQIIVYDDIRGYDHDKGVG
jgi:hypothetical protein